MYCIHSQRKSAIERLKACESTIKIRQATEKNSNQVNEIRLKYLKKNTTNHKSQVIGFTKKAGGIFCELVRWTYETN